MRVSFHTLLALQLRQLHVALHAVGALWSCAVDNPANTDAVRDAGGIGVLVGLARDGTDAQKVHAAGALRRKRR